ncbi:unnamed protein product [Rhizoctonia solani]|uniref:Uncharacterized protein n=1 Tax=Rhizoctonia solani TaxID=456999 RepID=A0A8H3DJ22_9AGAM|nr:unnamed protein product [Rhizoctonia solani]
MASLTMTPLDAQRPTKRSRRGTTGDTSASRHIYINERTRARPSRSASTSTYTHSSRRSSAATTPGSNSLSHSAYSLSRSQTSSLSSSPFIATSASSSRSRSAAEARALVLDPTYSGVGHTQARVYVDELGVAHDPDYRMFPAVPSSPRSCTARRGSVTSARGRCSTSGGCSESPFTGSPFAGYADFEMHYSNSVSHEVDTDEERPMCMDVDEDAESVLEWSRLHASTSPPVYEEGREEEKKTEDGYAEFAGMEWDEKEWRREEVVAAPVLDKQQSSSLASSKGKQSTPSPAPPAPIHTPPFSGSNASLPKSYSKAGARAKPKSSSKAGSASSTARGYVPSRKRSYDESIQDEWAPSCGYSVRRHWQSFTLRIRFTVFRWRRRLRRAFTSSSSGTGVDPHA